ncbi:Aminotransferase class I/classII [Macrophomina phaseolina MS6]|uniref:Aminotransferase class I/classII n=1 Tax=Macrophomina phaseolina (strain MS6) TaxID=1126212 RepID=K2R2W6_MACPH|nr:Aminotransferase class I/classII [Macrophomina phaseolina MS6]
MMSLKCLAKRPRGCYYAAWGAPSAMRMRRAAHTRGNLDTSLPSNSFQSWEYEMHRCIARYIRLVGQIAEHWEEMEKSTRTTKRIAEVASFTQRGQKRCPHEFEVQNPAILTFSPWDTFQGPMHQKYLLEQL